MGEAFPPWPEFFGDSKRPRYQHIPIPNMLFQKCCCFLLSFGASSFFVGNTGKPLKYAERTGGLEVKVPCSPALAECYFAGTA